MHFISLADAAPFLDALPRPVLHLKGFTNGLLLPAAPDPLEPALFSVAEVRELTSRAVATTLAHVKALDPATLVWDGDGLQPDSFAALIPMLARRRAGMQLVAFRYAHQRKTFEAEWGHAGLRVTVILVPRPAGLGDGDEPDYATLGFEAIRDTRAEECLCVGGGPVVLDEFRLTRGLQPAPRFAFLDVPRWKSRSEPVGALDHSPLMGVVPAEELLS